MKYPRLLWLVGVLGFQALVCPASWTAKLSETALEEMLPEDTIFLLSVPDASKLVSNFKASNAYKILQEIDPLALMEGQPQFEKVKTFYSTFIEPLTKVFHRRISLAIKSIPPRPGIPEVIFVADVGHKNGILRAYLRERIEPLVKQIGAEGRTFTHGEYEVREFSFPAPVPITVCYTVADEVFIATMGREMIEQVLELAAPPRSLVRSELFREVRQKVGEKSDFLIYVNTSALLGSLQPVIPKEVTAILEVSGLTGVKALGMGAEPLGSAAKSTWYMATGPERKGILRLIARKAGPLKAVNYVPEDVTFFYVLSLGDFDVLWDDLMSTLRKTVVSLEGDRAWEQIVAGLRQVENKSGFRIKEDLLAPFGGELCVAVKVPEVLGVPPFFLLIETKDAGKATALIDRLIGALEKAIGGPVLRTTQEYKGVRIASVSLVPPGRGAGGVLAMPFIRPAFAIVGDFLVVGVHSNSVKKIVDVHAGGKSLKDNADFQRVFSHLAPQGSLSFYLNLKEVYDFLYGAFGGIAAVQIGPRMVGKLGRISRYFGSAGSRVSCDDRGITGESFSDSGGAEQILVHLALVGFVPVFTSARQEALEAACANNLRQLALACMMYAVDHDDVLPSKLSDVYPDYVPDLRVFICPVHKGKEISKENIEAGSDYELKIPGVKLGEIKNPGRTVMIVEKEYNHPGRMKAAYADGHIAKVEYMVQEKAIEPPGVSEEKSP